MGPKRSSKGNSTGAGSNSNSIVSNATVLKNLQVRLNRIKIYVDNFNADEGIHNLRSRLTILQRCWDSYEEITDFDEIEDASQNFEETYCNLAANIQSLIDQFTPETEEVDCKPNTDSSNKQLSSLRLPVLKIVPFDGDFEKWVTFNDTYLSLVHNDKNLDKIQKFLYLRSFLLKEPAQLIANLTTSADNYDVAWGLLTKRYQNQRMITMKHVSSLFDIAKAEKQSYASLRVILEGLAKHINALQALGQPTDQWDVLVIHLITTKLDYVTLKEWENSLTSDIPTLKALQEFLEHKVQVLEAMEFNRPSKPKTSYHSADNRHLSSMSKTSSSFNQRRSTLHSTFSGDQRKRYCQKCSSKEHSIFACREFKDLSLSDKQRLVKDHKLCENCLLQGHDVKKCRFSSCRYCKNRHNSLLCSGQSSGQNMSSGNNATYTSSSNQTNLAATSSQVSHSSTSLCSKIVVLSTALVDIIDRTGRAIPARALLDTGSQSNYITESLAQSLGLKRNKINIDVSGINSTSTNIATSIHGTMKSRVSDYTTSLNLLVIPRITQDIPQVPIDISKLNIPPSLLLADPDFDRPGKIDLLVGADVFFNILLSGQIRLQDETTVLQSTSLGWIVSGTSAVNRVQSFVSTCHLNTLEENRLDVLMERFWQIEDAQLATYSLTPEERECEKHFEDTVTRDDSGQFVVSLPFKDSLKRLGSTREVALKRFNYNMKKLDKYPVIKERYYTFMKEYIELNHMRKVPNELLFDDSKITYHIPHHAVHKEASSSTKLRVVFDASTKSSTGLSLNDCLKVGPVVQQDLFSIVVRFRKHKIAVSADIAKMYRMFKLNPNQFDLHRIFWFDDSKDDIVEYQLTTLTYGTAPASFLATRCLNKLADIERERYPAAAALLEKDFYVDNMLSGFASTEEAFAVKEELNNLLATAGLDLRKWASNSVSFINSIPLEHQEVSESLDFDAEESIKTLGLVWLVQQDCFGYNVSIDSDKSVTKRQALSEICKLFDPLGLVAPILIRAKIFMQRTWELKISWDEVLPEELISSWDQFRSDISNLNSYQISRKIIPGHDVSHLELHGFCDASEVAYGACVYLRATYNNGETSTRLVCSKSRVAPLKSTTIPRLELCGAVLLAELWEKVVAALDINVTGYLWTDSTIVLGWLNSNSRLKTFVANRVLKILEITDAKNWHHIRSEQNPADCISRGATYVDLISSSLWWNGPGWLSLPPDHWPRGLDLSTVELPEVKTVSLVTSTKSNYFDRFSDLNKILRITIVWLRFKHNSLTSKFPIKLTEPLKFDDAEFEAALRHWIGVIQNECFKAEIAALAQRKPLKSKSKLLSLNPFLDEFNLIRVGGRLTHSNLSHNQKHPWILPSNHYFTDMIISKEHLRLLHAGPQSLLAAVRKKFWPLRGRDQVRRIVHKCVKCTRVNPPDSTQLMGELPLHRVEPSRPFLRTGVDFCGPMFVRETRRRKAPYFKIYVAVFICFSTKAVHLELVSDLTTQAFLAALRRFIGRRGKPSHVYSDNAKNFIGARNELHELYQMFNSPEHQRSLRGEVNWIFIPPRAPNYGGLWEASVKSLKFHLKRVIGNASLTIEEFNTVLIQAEACLNSRPLTPSSSDPTDLSSLTPGHFLIGEELTALPEPDLLPLKLNTLSRWQLLQRLTQQFWKRWSAEYLLSLQQRSKWRSTSPNLKIGTIVLLKEDNLPPLKWRLGRITELHPGEDNLVRVVSVFTNGGVMKRAISKICPLPIEV